MVDGFYLIFSVFILILMWFSVVVEFVMDGSS